MTGLSALAHEALGKVQYNDRPSALLFADSVAGLARCRRTAEQAGCRVSGAAGVAEAAPRLERQIAVDAVLVEVEDRGTAEVEPLMALLRDGAGKGRFSSVVVAPRDLMRKIAPAPTPPGLHCLSEPNGLDRLLAADRAVGRSMPRLHDVKGQGAPRLQQLSEEVGRIAHMLAALSEEDTAAAHDESGARVDAGLVRAIIRARRMREQYFGGNLFADPAWDMLLDLFAARLEDRRVAVSSLCIAAAVPPTTALRWIKTLSDQGVFVRLSDPLDGRRVFIQLSDSAAAGLEAYLKAAQRISPLIV